jgi:ABC-2 type transport system ATP-binding protein
MSAIARTEGLSKRYGRQEVLQGLDMIVEPSAGRAVVLDIDSRRLAPRHFQQIGYVSENQEMPEWMTVQYLMDYLKPFYPTWDDERARELLRAFELPGNRKLKHLSRGMRMKAALASSLAYRPKLLVLDEPFTGLDPLVRDEFIEGLVESAQETTMLISSHDLAEIESFATHIGFLDGGRLQFSESMSTLSERFREIEVTRGERTGLPDPWPAHWLQPEASTGLIRFVDSRFDRERTFSEVRRIFGDTVHVADTPMSLRAIFVTLARQSRKAA